MYEIGQFRTIGFHCGNVSGSVLNLTAYPRIVMLMLQIAGGIVLGFLLLALFLRFLPLIWTVVVWLGYAVFAVATAGVIGALIVNKLTHESVTYDLESLCEMIKIGGAVLISLFILAMIFFVVWEAYERTEASLAKLGSRLRKTGRSEASPEITKRS